MIDANLRTPQLHTYFNLDNKAGLSDILAERATLAALTRIPQFVVDLSVLTAGTQPPNPTELLARSNLGDLIAQLSRHYDVILIDTPPAQQSADFQTVSANAGGALISVRKNRTHLNEVAAIKDMLAAAGAEVVGAVINAH